MAAARLIGLLRRELARAGTPGRAEGARAYMKSEMPFHGVSTTEMRAICRRVFEHDAFAFADAGAWRRDVLALWREARFREERYAAIALAEHRLARAFQTLDALPIYEEMIVTGAWWDLVDPIATHLLSRLLVNEPRAMKKKMLVWSRSADIWKRRAAILCQIPRKADTDLELLYACIEPSLGRPEFFLRKAIGWALRQYAWTDPKEIVRYVEANRDRLSPLSVREALKNVTSSPARGAARRSASDDPRTRSRARRASSRSGG